MEKLTDKQINYMNIIARCLMNSINGAVPESADEVDTFVWADERAANMGISEKALGGVMSSLQNEEYIWVSIDNRYPDESGVGFTEKGFNVWSADSRADKSE